MQRRRLVEQPRSVLAVWARRFAIFAVPVVLLAIIMAQAGQFEAFPILVTFGAGLLLAVLAILIALAALIGIWIDGRAGAGYALVALAFSFVLLAYPAYFGVKGYRLPPINDITTDPYDPPRLEAAQRLRVRTANSTAYGGLGVYERQRAAYPDIAPVSVDVAPQAAYDAAFGVVTKRKWVIVNARPPQADRREGIIEAVARTPIMGFRDDVVIRIRPAGPGTSRVDARSASRYGIHDFGANASRLMSLLDDIDDAATPPEIPEPAGKKGQPPKGKAPPGKPGQPARR
jgi:uncharacterized protein (DUF1499 family)